MAEENRFNKQYQPVQDLATSRQKSFSPDSMRFVANDIKRTQTNKVKMAEDLIQEANISYSLNEGLFSKKSDKISLTENTDFNEVYAKAGDIFTSRYSNFLKGTDNNERLARQQTSGEKWANGLFKAGINFRTTVVGGTVGSVTGVANWINSGFETEGLYTDDFNQWLDGVNEKANFKLPNYYSRQEQDLNFGQSLGTANFWANDFAGGVSFTLGAIVSEALWAFATGGAGLATTAARWSLKGSKLARLTKGVNSYSKIGKTMIRNGYTKQAARQAQKTATRVGKTADLANTARFTYTSAGYEAGVEARHFMKEAEENFRNYYETNFGRQPNAEELRSFKEDNTTAGNSVWAGNIALIGASNLAVFGRMFNLKNPLLKSGTSLRKGANKKLFGIGTTTTTEGGRLASKALQPTTLQKIAGRTRDFAKAPLIEGFWEEGNQSVLGNLGEDWLTSGYDLEASKDNYDMIGGIFDSYAKTYGSKEGWKEVGIGMMVGLLGGAASGGLNDYGKQLKNQKAIADVVNSEIGAQGITDFLRKDGKFGVNGLNETLKDSSLASQKLGDNIATANRINRATQEEAEAESRGDITAKELSRKKAILANISMNKKYDRLDDAYEDFKTSLELADSQQWADEIGVDKETIEAYKQEVFQEYSDLQQEFSANKDFADLIVGRNATTKDLKNKNFVSEAIAYNMTMGAKSAETAEIFLDEIDIEMAEIVSPEMSGKIKNALEARKILETSQKQNKESLFSVQKRKNKVKKDRDNLQSQILGIQKKLERLGTDNVEQKQAEQSKLLSLSEELRDLEILENNLNRESETAFETLKANSPFKTREDSLPLTSQQLDEILDINEKGEIVGGTLSNIDKVIRAQEEVNPRKASKLKKLFNEYQKSVYAFKEYNKTIQGISNENFSPANFATKLEQKIAGITKREANEFTREFFANVGMSLATDTKDLMDSLGNTTTTSTESELNNVTYESEFEEGDYAKLSEAVERFLDPNVQGTVQDLQMFKNYPVLSEALIALEGKKRAELKNILKNINSQDFLLSQAQKDSFLEKRRNEINNKYDNLKESILNKKQENKTEIDRLNDLIQQTTQENNLISNYVGEDLGQAKENTPTEQDIEDFKAISKKLQGTGFLSNNYAIAGEYQPSMPISEQEFTRLKELNNKLSNWQVMEGTMVSGVNASLADLITRATQLETVLERPIKEEQTIKDIIELENVSEKNSSVSRNDIRTIQTLNGVYIKVGKSGSISLSHVNLDNFIAKYLSQTPTKLQVQKQGSKKKIDITPSELNNYQKDEGNRIFITTENDVVEVTIGKRATLDFSKETWESIREDLKLQFLYSKNIDPQAMANSYVMGYEVLEDGTILPAKSDFTVDSALEAMTPQELVNLDKVLLKVDPKNEYNKKLLDEYNKAVKSKKQVNIDKALQNLEANIGVSLTFSNKFVGFLRAGIKNNGTTDTSIKFTEIRKAAAKKLIESENNNLIDLETTIPVNFKYRGSPVFSLSKTADGLSINNKDISPKELKKIKDAGYVERGKLVIGGKVNTESVIKTYLPNTNKRTPVIVFENNGELIAFVVNVKPSSVDLSNNMYEILSNDNLTKGQKVNQLNSLLLQNNIEPGKFELNENSLTNVTKLEEVEKELQQVKVLPKIEQWAEKTFNLNNLSLQASLPIDITNSPFNSPKIVLDIKSAEVTQPSDFRESIEESSLQLLDKIQGYISEILTKQSEYIRKDGTVIEDTTFTDVIDNDVYEKDASTFANKAGNLRKLSKAISKAVPKTIIDVHGKEFFDNLKRDLKKYEGLNKERRKLSKSIKDKVNNKKNQEC